MKTMPSARVPRRLATRMLLLCTLILTLSGLCLPVRPVGAATWTMCTDASSTDSTGTLYDSGGAGGNYGNNQNCGFLIDPGGTFTEITLSFSAFDLETDADFLYVYDGTDETGLLLATLTGGQVPQDVIATSGSLYLQFDSDGSVTRPGFAASWSTADQPDTFYMGTAGAISSTLSSGNIYDSGGPNGDYYDNQNSTFLISPAVEHTEITLSFSAFDLETDADFMYVYDGTDESGILLATLTGGQMPQDVIATSGNMFLRFSSDGSIPRPGFAASWSTANQPDTFYMGTGSTSSAGCSGTLYDSGGPTGDYRDDETSTFLIDPHAGSITLSFSAFDLETDFDYLYVYDGSSDTDPLLATLTGGLLPSDVTATSGSMFLKFTSDTFTTRPGFAAAWSSASCTGLAINKTDHPAVVTPGGVLTYTILVGNNTISDTTDVLISDTLPAEVTFAGPVTLEGGSGGSVATGAGDLPTLVSGLTITAGETVTVTFPVTTSAVVISAITVTNTATVTSTQVPTPTRATETTMIGDGPKLVMVTADGTFDNGDDLARQQFFESLGYIVTAIADSDSQATYDSAAAGHDVMFISSSASGLDVNTKAQGLDVGIVSEETSTWRDLQYGTSSSTGSSTGTALNITDDGHYITSPFRNGSLTVYTSPDALGYWDSLSVSLAPGAQVLAEMSGDADHEALIAIDTGAALFQSHTAPNRRVLFPSASSSVSHWNADFRTLLERALEWAASTESNSAMVVDTTADTVDGDTTGVDALLADKGADGRISLREATMAANNTAGTDTINFNIAEGGTQTIQVTSALPDINEALMIDGTTQPGFAGTPLVHLDGSLAAGVNGFRLASSGSTLLALAIHDFDEHGVTINSGTGNALSESAIYANGKLGINLAGGAENGFGVTANDADDSDGGPNNLQNYPVLSGAVASGGQVTVNGVLTSTAGTTFTLEFFANGTRDASAYGEGERFLGRSVVTTTAGGGASFSANLTATVAVTESVAATATDPDGNTSEFSANVTVTGPEITVDPLSLSFGAQDIDAGPTVSQTVVITNEGTADLNVTGVSIVGADAAEFAIASDTGEATLVPGGTRTVRVSFDPTSTGAKTADLRISSDDGDEGTVDVTLSGSGSTDETDTDGDGIPDNVEEPGDTDGDGTPDYLDDDDDGDGVPTVDECPAGPPCPDSNGDGTPDYLDEDAVAALSVFKTVVGTGGHTVSLPLGSVITYTLILSNSGEGAAFGVMTTDPLPNGVTFGGWVEQGSATIPSLGGPTARWPQDGSLTIMWGPQDVPADTAYRVVFTATLTSNEAYAGHTVINRAFFNSINAGFDADDAPVILERCRLYVPLLLKDD